jgi:hypothetical protein
LRNSQINKLQKKQTFTQLLAGCLFAIFLINTIFCFIFFEVKRIAIRHEIKHKILQQLTDNQLVIFSKTENFDKDEFEHNGIMYDVVRQETINGKVVLLCFEDKKETQLNHSIEASVKKDLANSPIKNTQQKLINFLKLSFISFQKFTFSFLRKPTSKQFYDFNKIIFSTFVNVLSPPPDFK